MNAAISSRRRPSVAVIGAGVAGLVCARVLLENGHSAAVFDKGRRPGGRVATRRIERFTFDHGAQYFTIETDDLPPAIASAACQGAIAPWDGTMVAMSRGHWQTIDDDRRRWVGVPGMSALPRHLSTGLDVRCGHAIAEVARAGDAWRLVGENGAVVAETDFVVVAVPAPQAAALLAGSSALANRADAIKLAPCWAAMLGFETPLALPFDGAFVDDGPLAWMSRDCSKPGRGGGEAWVLHASTRWSRDHLEAERPVVLENLSHAFRSATAIQVPKPAFAAAHRWRYARVEKPLGEPCLFDTDLKIGACGDWCLGGKIEAALASGRALADRIIHDRASATSYERA